MASFLPHPGSLPNDPIVALRDPDRFAWHLFWDPTWLADLDARTAAPKAGYGHVTAAGKHSSTGQS